MDEASARAAADASPVLQEGTWWGQGRELREGWFFPMLSREMMAGCNGVIVNKRTGKLFHLGSAFPIQRDIDLYDRGYQFERYDLEIVAVANRAQTLDVLRKLRFQVVEPTEEHGVVWKIPRDLTAAELSHRLHEMPCIFAAVKLYFVAELLEDTRRAGWFTFELREHA